MDIVMTGYAGLAASKALAISYEEQLLHTLSKRFLTKMQELPEDVYSDSMKENSSESSFDPANLPHVQMSRPRKQADGTVIPAMVMAVPVDEGGVYEALWALGEMARTGLHVDLTDIPIRQETIEVCEVVDVNPYQLPAGCWMYLADNGNGCPGRVIGQTTKEKGRTITGAEGTRYLEKPRQRK